MEKNDFKKLRKQLHFNRVKSKQLTKRIIRIFAISFVVNFLFYFFYQPKVALLFNAVTFVYFAIVTVQLYLLWDTNIELKKDIKHSSKFLFEKGIKN